jgi:enoyl-CoA hydratase/carnithine racemase
MPIGYEVRDHIATITIDGHNDLNPMTQTMYTELHQRFQEIDRDPEVRVAILRGGGERNFSAGGDLKAVGNRTAADPVEDALRNYWYPNPGASGAPGSTRTTLWGHRTLTPVIGAVRGHVIGAALILFGFHTSLRIASETAKFGFSEVKLGLGGGAIAWSGFAQQRIPRSMLMWMAATGQSIDARKALQVGMINEVVPDERLMDRAYEVAAMVAKLAPNAVRAPKVALNATENVPLAESLQFAWLFGTLNRLGPDAAEGINAFAEKRPPNFKGV